MNYNHKHNGQFGSKKRGRKFLLTVIVLCAIIPIGGQLTNHYEFIADYFSPKTLTYRAEAAEIVTPDTIENMKGDVLDRLAKCESGGKETTIVFDSNGKASVGNYQWQLASFRHYYKKMTGEDITERQAALMALDDAKARELAAYVIFETDKGVGSDWFNCNSWHDLDTLVDFIKAHD